MSFEDMTRRPGESPDPRGRHDAFERIGEEAYRATIARRLLSISLLVGTILLVPTVVISYRSGERLSLVCDAVVYLAFLALFLFRRLPSRLTYAAVAGLGALLGSLLLFRSEGGGAADAWLMASAVVATIFFGARGGLALGAVTTVVYALVLSASHLRLLPWQASTESYALRALNVVGLSLLCSFAIARLIDGYRGAIRVQGKLSVELGRRQIELEREVAGRATAEERAAFLESHDGMTGLPNREGFRLELGRALAIAAGRGRILAVMVLGLDRFKRITSTRGQRAGDEILREAGKRLALSIRQDDCVGRLGGDAFAVIFSDVKSQDDIKEIIDKARRVFDRSFPAAGTELAVSASFGIALYPNDGQLADDLLGAAESALQLAKEDGPGSYRVFDAALHARLLERVRIEHELGSALRLSSFEPWFQPKVDRFGRVVGAEALARWNLPDGGLRLPSDFIDIAERSGAISNLGRIVLHKACLRAVDWQKMGLPAIPVSVNLSPFQFRSEDLVSEVRSIIADTGIDPSRLDLEITESGIMENEYEAVEKLAELKTLGLQVSIDDFGTGYSSFAMLKDFPVDAVKLPKSFVEPLPSDLRASMVAGAVIDLAHNLNFSVVAEGVETLAQFAWLDDARCDQYQGYLFSPPLSARNFAVALATGLPTAVQ